MGFIGPKSLVFHPIALYTIGMKNIYILTVMGCLFLFSAVVSFAQSAPAFSAKSNAQIAAVNALGNNAASQTSDSYDPFGFNQQVCTRSRQATDTVEQVINDVQEKEQARGDVLLAILKDIPYLSSLSVDEANELLYGFAYANNTCHTQITQTIFSRLNKVEYNEDSADYPINIFYTLAAATLGHNYDYHQQIEDWAFKRVEFAARVSDRSAIWPSLVLTSLAEGNYPGDYPYVMNERERDAFERRMEQAIARFDYLKGEPADYYALGMRNVLKQSNQFILEGLLLQSSSFFAAKDKDSFWKGMLSTGGLKPLLRLATANSEEDANARFSDRGETFYLSYTSPGTDGAGHFADSDNGRRHYVLSQLVQALCISYIVHGNAEGSYRIKKFVRSYLRTNEGYFIHYLHIPLSAIRSGTELLDSSSLHGWEEESATLLDEMTSTLRASYRAAAVMTDIHGAAEVASEWVIIGQIFEGVMSVGKYAFRGADKAIMRFFPAKAVARYVAMKAGSKQMILFCKEGTKNFLKQHKWGIGATAVGTTVIVSDSHHKSSAH